MDRPHLMSGGRYPVLRSLGILYLIGAGVSILAGVAGIVWAFADGPGDMSDRLIIAGAMLAGTFFLVLSMLAFAELLKLFIDVEHNTRTIGMSAPAATTTSVTAPPSGAVVAETTTSRDGGRINRIQQLDEETAEEALIRGH